jgi:MFS family permease
MLITRCNPIPTRWILMAILPWTALMFQWQVMGTAFTFSLSKFVENPAALTLLLSLPGFVSIVLAPLAQFLSDRIWTRFGRRKPFIVAGGAAMYSGLLVMAFAPSASVLVAGYFLYSFGADFYGALEPLKQEIVPPPQRGSATAVMQWLSNFCSLLFFAVVLGRFDEVGSLFGVLLTGETAAYASCVVLGLTMLAVVMLGVKEANPHSVLCGQRLTPRTILGGLLDREFRPVYLLVFGAAILNAGLGPLNALLTTVQFGMTKQQMGYNVAIGTTLNLLIFIPLIGLFADRLNRTRAYGILISLTAAVECAFFLYVRYVLVHHRPTWQEMVVFGGVLSVASILTQVVFTPMVYDYIRRDKMGTYAAGANLLMRATSIVTLNLMGLFVWGYATLFQPPAGEMCRVTLSREVSREDLRELVAVPWTEASTPVARLWRATGADLPTGRAIEFRRRNRASERLDAERTRLQSDLRRLGGDVAAHAPATQERAAALSSRLADIDSQLADRAAAFRDEVVRVLGASLLADGQQVLSAEADDGRICTFLLTRRPRARELEHARAALRAHHADIIDACAVARDGRFALAVSVASTSSPDCAADELHRTLAASVPGLVSTAPALETPVRVLRLGLATVEEPLDRFVSPLNRWLIHPLLAKVGRVPAPTDRLRALGRALRLAGTAEHARVEPLEVGNGILVSAVLAATDSAAPGADDVAARLAELLGDSETTAQAQRLYRHTVAAAEVLHLTVARRQLTHAYAGLAYDYMAGYLLMFVGSVVGVALTLAFRRLERRGRIRKHGCEEAASASVDLAATEDAFAGVDGSAGHVPGYFWPKVGLAFVGLVMMASSLCELWQPLRLVLTGARGEAEAVRIVKRGAEESVKFFADENGARRAEETRDRSWRFSTEFAFVAEDGRTCRVECPVGSQLKPVFRLTDSDGLPTTVVLRYDSGDPRHVVFPMMLGTWFMPGMLLLCGVLALFSGAMLAAVARRPVSVSLNSLKGML